MNNVIVPKDLGTETVTAAHAAVQKVYEQGGAVIDTATLLDEVARNNGAQALNRNYVSEHADPEGLHLLFPVLFHNDREFRCRVLIKHKGTDVPREALVDLTPEQFEKFRKGTERNVEILRRAAEQA